MTLTIWPSNTGIWNHDALKGCSGHTHTVYPWSRGQVSIWKLFDSLNPKPRVLFQSSGTISVLLDTMNLTDNQIFLQRVWLGLLCSYYAVWKRTGNRVWGEVEERRLRPLFSSTLITWNSGNCSGSISDTVYPFRNNHLISLPSPGAKKSTELAQPSSPIIVTTPLTVISKVATPKTTAILTYLSINSRPIVKVSV